MPLIPGHEMMGVVRQCILKPELVGKRVGIFPLIPCMECAQCRSGHYEMCDNYNYLGSRCDGGFAEYVNAPVWNLIQIPDNITDDEAAMLEPMCVAVHAIRNIGLIQINSATNSDAKSDTNKYTNKYTNTETNVLDIQPNIVICGLGTIGLFVAMFLKDAGYQNVICIGNKDLQKKTLLEMGYREEDYCDIRTTEPLSFINAKTDGIGADYYFECIGRPENYEKAITYAAPLGKVMLVGNPSADMNLPKEIYWKILRRQITLKGTWNSSYPDDWNYVVERLSSWNDTRNRAGSASDTNFVLNPSVVITHRFTLDSMDKGLLIMRDKTEEYIKVMVTL